MTTRNVSIEPYRGTVIVRFSDAIIASSDEALAVTEQGSPTAYYIPFRDIYFDFMARSGEEGDVDGRGAVAYWDVSAVGEGAREAMWSYDEPPAGLQRLAQHGAFAPDKVNIELDPAPDYTHEVHVPKHPTSTPRKTLSDR